jgi:epoxyqueuosine reductase
MMNVDTLREQLRQTAVQQGAKAFGIADLDMLRRTTPDLLCNIPGTYTRAVVFGMRLQRAVLDSIQNEPTPLYVHNYRQLNYQLDRAAWCVADQIQDAGGAAVAVAASQIVQSVPMTGHVSHKLLGWAAGLGHIGRSTLLVHPAFGAQMRYASVLTDLPLPPDRPVERSCGTCRQCRDMCPAAAIGEASGDFNLMACYRKLNTEFVHVSFVGQHVCGVCLKACPGAGVKEACGE